MRQSLGLASTGVCGHEAQIERHGREYDASACPMQPRLHDHCFWFQASQAGLPRAG